MEIEHQLCCETTKEEYTALSDLGPMVEEADAQLYRQGRRGTVFQQRLRQATTSLHRHLRVYATAVASNRRRLS
jgi:hypothetical protein